MPRPSPARAPRAFTLIELMIVMSVIALLAAAAAPALGGLTGANARKGAGELAATMRALFDSASVRHQSCRLVLDPAERSYWAECAAARGPVEVDPGKEAESGRSSFRREKPAGVAGPADPGYAAFTDSIVRKRELPGEANFAVVQVDGRDAIAGGQAAFIRFFPGGRAQAAVVTVADGGNRFTVRLEPFTGRARVTPGGAEERGP